MKRYLAFVFCGALGAGACGANEATETPAPAAGTAPSGKPAEEHVAAARAVFEQPGQVWNVAFNQCTRTDRDTGVGPVGGSPREKATEPGPAAPRDVWYMEPVKVFDNLYYVGTAEAADEPGLTSAWLVTTSEGYILVNSNHWFNAEELLDKNLRKIGLDPAQIKYVIVSHAHSDHYGGAKYLQDKYGARVVLSEADWNVLAQTNDYDGNKPKKDIVAIDGGKITLGDGYVITHLTPGHTAGMMTVQIPLKDGNNNHMSIMWGGMGAIGMRRYGGVQYFPTMLEALKSNGAAAKRMRQVAADTNGDVFLSIHGEYDDTYRKLKAVRARKPGEPHPFVNRNDVDRFFAILGHCSAARIAWLKRDLAELKAAYGWVDGSSAGTN